MQFRADKEFLQALLNLQSNEDFQRVLKGLQAYHLQCGLEFPRFDGKDLLQLQGRSALALELITSMDPVWARAELEQAIMTEAAQLQNEMLAKKTPY